MSSKRGNHIHHVYDGCLLRYPADLSPTESTKEITIYPKELSSREEDQSEQTKQIPRRCKYKKKEKPVALRRERERGEGGREPEGGKKEREGGNGKWKKKRKDFLNNTMHK